MPIPLQKTKLFIPPTRENLVDRPRLTARLDWLLGEGCRAALISAPAGSGKTTLVVQWLSRRGIPAGWLSLDDRDNLPVRFFSYLIAALQSIAPEDGDDAAGLGREALPLLELPGANPEEIVTLLTNDLVKRPGPFILVLDDFHAITNPLLHQAVDFLIEAQPPKMRLVLLSREDPALQLARRRARGQLVELRQADLSFTLEEAVAFLNQRMDLHLTTGQVEILEARTEGWIAGLQMASLALQAPIALQAPLDSNQPAYIERFLQNFSGSHHFILDYLMEEVLARQTAEVQAFLLETSILERFCAELCEYVIRDSAIRDSGMTPVSSSRITYNESRIDDPRFGESRITSPSQSILERLEKANLFVIPLDEERRWYRYHHLFGDLLLARLRSEAPARAAELERRASDWFEANGESRLAVEYALKAQDFQHAADLIERHITERWQTVDMEFFKLVNRLPFEVLAGRPTLCLQSAWLCVIFGQTDAILHFVEAAERALDRPAYPPEKRNETNAPASRAFARTLRAYIADLRNQPAALPEGVAETLEMAYAAIPETNPGMRNSVAVVIGMICFMEGDFASAMRYYEAALALDKRVNGTNAVPIATIRIWLVLVAQGQLREAMRKLRESEAYVRERGIRRFYISGSLNLRMADLLLEWNRLDEAEAQIQEGMRLLEDWNIPGPRSLGLNLLARARLARGDLEGATAVLEQVDAIRQQTDLHPTFLDSIEKTRVQLFLAEHNRAALEAWAEQNEHIVRQPLRFRYEARLIELCRVWMALNRFEQSARLLKDVAEAAQGRNGSRVSILALLAAALYQEPDRALLVLEEALRLAEPEGYLRTFLEAGEPLFQALRLWLQRGHSKDDPRLRGYVEAILSASGRPGPAISMSHSLGMVEPLSQREQEVLRLIAKGLTNQQIADRLVISVRTVKKHVENIHGKMGVLNRTQAVARARELRLLE